MQPRTPVHTDDAPRVARRTGWKVARIAGIEVWIDRSWVFSLALLSYYAWSWITRELLPVGSTLARLAISVGFGLALVVCILVHELAHSLVARGYGLPVRRITLFALGGVSQIEREASTAAAEFNIALAGPLASIVIAAIFAGIARGLDPATDHFHGSWGWLAMLNLALALFNLIPAFPMDGGRILRSALWAGVHDRARATRWSAIAGRVFAIFLIGLGISGFVYGAAHGNGDAGFSIMAIFIGLFLYNAATASQRAEGGARPNEPPVQL